MIWFRHIPNRGVLETSFVLMECHEKDHTLYTKVGRVEGGNAVEEAEEEAKERDRQRDNGEAMDFGIYSGTETKRKETL